MRSIKLNVKTKSRHMANGKSNSGGKRKFRRVLWEQKSTDLTAEYDTKFRRVLSEVKSTFFKAIHTFLATLGKCQSSSEYSVTTLANCQSCHRVVTGYQKMYKISIMIDF